MKIVFDPMHPDHAVKQIRDMAQMLHDDAIRLSSDWQDVASGRPWEIIALELDRAANKANQLLLKRTEWGIR